MWEHYISFQQKLERRGVHFVFSVTNETKNDGDYAGFELINLGGEMHFVIYDGKR